MVALSASFVRAAEGPPGATVRPEGGKPAAERANRDEWCKANPEKCREMQAKMKERQEQCKADPEKCKVEMQAREQERFSRADTNKDGKLTREEAQKSMPGVARRFDLIDANKDGFITKEELEAARKARAAQRKDKAT
jgi:hypothetical protein